MRKNFGKIGGLLVLLSVLLAACGMAADQEPTPDVVAIKTQAVETAMAEMTVQAALNPSATPLPPTITPLPTATRFTQTPMAASGSSSGGSTSGGSGGGGSKLATRTPTWPSWSSDDYRCEFVDQYPYDQAQKAGTEYDIVWTVRNIGDRKWWTNLTEVVRLSGAEIAPYKSYQLPKNVNPGETVQIRVDIHLPTNPTEQMLTTEWGIKNDQGTVFCRFYHSIPRLY
jgi:hypothetical protein